MPLPVLVPALLAGCLLDKAGYLARVAELTDHDGDGYVQQDDCDDADASVFPGATETCDGVDDDCNGLVDDNAVDRLVWYPDADGDGYGVDANAILACDAPTSTWINRGGDCDDTQATVSPAGTEIAYDGVDQDCSGADLNDVDGDGFVARQAGGDDCDDADASVHPGATEVPYDGVDQDCSGADLNDLDGDGFVATEAGGDDCDDADAAVFPGAAETWANGFTDNDCDGDPGAAVLEYGGEEWVGTAPGAGLGWLVRSLGDVDGDGLADFVTTSLFDSSVYSDAGSVTLVRGGTTGALTGATEVVAGGADWYLGAGLDAGTDATGDGVPDVLVGADGYSAETGRAWLIDGTRLAAATGLDPLTAAFGSVTGDESGMGSGISVAFLGDVIGDGSVCVGEGAVFGNVDGQSEEGEVAIFGGLAGDVMFSNGDIEVVGSYAGGHLGGSVSAAGDYGLG